MLALCFCLWWRRNSLPWKNSFLFVKTFAQLSSSFYVDFFLRKWRHNGWHFQAVETWMTISITIEASNTKINIRPSPALNPSVRAPREKFLWWDWLNVYHVALSMENVSSWLVKSGSLKEGGWSGSLLEDGWSDLLLEDRWAGTLPIC